MNTNNVFPVLRLKPRIKKFGIKNQPYEKEITPFIGYSTEENKPTLGFGFETNDGQIFFYSNTLFPHNNLIQAWRSAKLIAKLDFVTDTLLREIWIVMGRDPIFPDLSSDLVSKACKDEMTFKTLRRSIMDEYPSIDLIDTALKILLRAKVKVNTEEIESEKNLLASRSKIPSQILSIIQGAVLLKEGNLEKAIKLVGKEKVTIMLAATAAFRAGLTTDDPEKLEKTVFDFLLSKNIL